MKNEEKIINELKEELIGKAKKYGKKYEFKVIDEGDMDKLIKNKIILYKNKSKVCFIDKIKQKVVYIVIFVIFSLIPSSFFYYDLVRDFAFKNYSIEKEMPDNIVALNHMKDKINSIYNNNPDDSDYNDFELIKTDIPFEHKYEFSKYYLQNTLTGTTNDYFIPSGDTIVKHT
jgi:hypothetical protein